MLNEAKKALRMTTDAYDGEIARLLMAGALDLETVGVILPGSVSFVFGENDAVTDQSTLADPLAMRAILTYVRMHFGSPNDYERVARSYELQKTQLMHAANYTNYQQDGEWA